MTVSLRCVPGMQYGGRLYKYLFTMIAFNVYISKVQSCMPTSLLQIYLWRRVWALVGEAVAGEDRRPRFGVGATPAHSVCWEHSGE